MCENNKSVIPRVCMPIVEPLREKSAQCHRNFINVINFLPNKILRRAKNCFHPIEYFEINVQAIQANKPDKINEESMLLMN